MDFRSLFEQYLGAKSGQAGPWIMARCPDPCGRHKDQDNNHSLGCNIESGGLKCHLPICPVQGSIYQWYKDLENAATALEAAEAKSVTLLSHFDKTPAGASV